MGHLTHIQNKNMQRYCKTMCPTIRTSEPDFAPHHWLLAMTFWIENSLSDWLKPKLWRDLPQLWLDNLRCSTGSAANVPAGLQNRKLTSHPYSLGTWHPTRHFRVFLTFVFSELGVNNTNWVSYWVTLVMLQWMAAEVEPTCIIIINCGPQVHVKSNYTITITLRVNNLWFSMIQFT